MKKQQRRKDRGYAHAHAESRGDWLRKSQIYDGLRVRKVDSGLYRVRRTSDKKEFAILRRSALIPGVDPDHDDWLAVSQSDAEVVSDRTKAGLMRRLQPN